MKMAQNYIDKREFLAITEINRKLNTKILITFYV